MHVSAAVGDVDSSYGGDSDFW